MAEEAPFEEVSSPSALLDGDVTDEDLPQCKIKRNYSCSLCPFFSQNPRSFLYHSRDVHFDKIKIYECSQCLYASKHSQKLQRHINMIHVPGRNPPKKVVPKKVTEKKQIKTSLIEMAMIQQENSGADETKAKCSICSFTSRSAALITRHERVVHMKKKFLRCMKCSYVTHVKARYTKHVKYHSMPMIKCDLCDFRTPYKWNLDRHYKNHCGSGAFQCSKCNFRADIKQSLTVHEMNHHIPPVGAGAAILMRKKNKVGASETTALESDGIDRDELEMLRMEREEEDDQLVLGSDDEEPDLNADPPSKLESALNRAFPTPKQTRLEESTSFAHPSNYLSFKPFKCKFCNHKCSNSNELVRHEKRNHGYVRDKRPPPNLIPIQGNSSPILKIPEVRTTRSEPEVPIPMVNDEEFKEMCKNSCLTSSLKEFVSLIGDEEALKTIPDTNEDQLMKCSSDDQEYQTNYLKRKNSNFFDKIKEKLSQGSEEHCGFESNSPSELVANEKKHSFGKDKLVVSGKQLSSTRCQHCRQRCKTSADLVAHLKNCKAYETAFGVHSLDQNSKDTIKSEENRVFIWNNFAQTDDDDDETFRDVDSYGDIALDSPVEFPSDLLETQLGSPEPSTPSRLGRETPALPEQPSLLPVRPSGSDLKKVFKCPHCSFWASTASRFHVHIVGHLNKKPFECSLCSYRSNWRWDITKHIRLKSARDPNHTKATVNMTDETGRRNYSKYNKYLTMMKVHEPSADSSGSGRRTRACDVTQGTVREGDILQPIPEPPKLTPAPASASSTKSSPQASSLRPLPLLQPAHTSSVCKRTLWKCKKCLYRNSDKEKVLTHVKSHYSKKMIISKEESEKEDSAHSSQGEEIIPEDDKNASASDAETAPSLDLSQVIACDICPFTTETEGDLTAHKLNHIDRPGSIFKCSYCPFYVPSKIAVLEHMEVHGEKSDPLTKANVDNFDPSERLQRSEKGLNKTKRFRCRQCPYLSNSKTQFLYHKQFHRPRNTQFKCIYCSYNVTRRHLLHQHLRVHHMHRYNSKDDATDIPLVWVLRGGSYLKMYKCRWCPHVNLRRINIQEHEKMHKDKYKLQCPDCNYTCNNAGVLSSHIKVHSGFFGEIRSLVDPTKSDEEQIENLQNSSSAAEPEIVIKVEEPDPEPSTPESSYYQTSTKEEESASKADSDIRTISFCNKCPARFFFKKELRIHSKFHLIKLPFNCLFCSYTARQRPHLLAHLKVHSQEYQERTAALVDTYMVHPEHQQPKIAMLTKKSELIDSPVWSVISSENLTRKYEVKASKHQPKHSCNRCPAKFFKLVALQYHQTLHGSEHQHRCKYCDYAVKTYGNLIKHQLVHESTNTAKSNLVTSKKEPSKCPDRKADPQFGVLMHGSPDFIYPTYFKNGKLKEKRYKCPKCPSAFEKRDQYKIHLSLHGSKQKYKCEKCDYSVKYYANYVQHVKKHKNNEEAHKVSQVLVAVEPLVKEEPSAMDCYSPPPATPPPLTQIEKQTLMLLEMKRKVLKEDEKKTFFCELCPYTNFRKDCLENHERRHFFFSGIRYGYNCKFCDYSTTQSNFLREHSRVHFKSSYYQPEAYVLLSELELWCIENEEEQEQLIFKDCGDGQYLPDVVLSEDEMELEPKLFLDLSCKEIVQDIDLKEEVLDLEPESDIDALLERPNQNDMGNSKEVTENMIELIEEITDEKPKVKRLRGKNWRCIKCPHAFGKKDQFQRHVALHGSNQKYSCGICDYSVKFYTNYVQHMRMHQTHEPDAAVEIKQYSSESKTNEATPINSTLCESSSNESWASLSDHDADGDSSIQLVSHS